jgi:hypothetical protein
MTARPRRTTFPLAALTGVIAILATAAIAGCGGSSARVASRPAALTPAQSNADVGGPVGAPSPHHARHGVAPATPTHPGQPVPVQPARSSGSASNDEHHQVVRATNPCRLVSVAQAQSITGGVVSSTEAPLGPTCIYKAVGTGKSDITLAVESLRLADATQQMHQRQALNIRGHLGYCGTLGRPMLFVSVGSGKVLNITAPCSIASRLADLALGRLTA